MAFASFLQCKQVLLKLLGFGENNSRYWKKNTQNYFKFISYLVNCCLGMMFVENWKLCLKSTHLFYLCILWFYLLYELPPDFYALVKHNMKKRKTIWVSLINCYLHFCWYFDVHLWSIWWTFNFSSNLNPWRKMLSSMIGVWKEEERRLRIADVELWERSKVERVCRVLLRSQEHT